MGWLDIFHLYLFELHFYQQFLLNIGILISKRFLQIFPAFIIKIIRQAFEPLTRYKDLYVLLQCIVLLPLKSCHADLCISGAIHPSTHAIVYTLHKSTTQQCEHAKKKCHFFNIATLYPIIRASD